VSTTWSERALEQLRTAGYRRGGARMRVIGYLDAQDCCVAAQDIHQALHASGERVGLATVYRVLDALVGTRLVQRVDLGDGVARFEPVRDSVEHHHHIVCDDCGRVEPFTDERLEQALERVAGRLGYAMQHEVLLRGTCGDCR
jgi:Fur family ferric uptake transcriptional regulator